MFEPRRRFLALAAGFPAFQTGLAPAADSVLSFPASSIDYPKDVTCISAFGGRGDWTGSSGTENRRAFEKAFESCRVVTVPPGNYMCEGPILIRSGRHLVGSGVDLTQITNMGRGKETSVKAGLIVGNMHPYAFDRRNPPEHTFPSFAIAAVRAPAREIKPLEPSASGIIKSGDYIFVRTKEEEQFDGYTIPHFAQLTKVQSAPKADGSFDVNSPISSSIENPLASLVSGRDPYTGLDWHVVENASVSHLSVEALDLIAPRTGCVGVVLDSLRGVGTRYLLGLNAFCHSSARNIAGDWSAAMLEIKMGSHDSYFEKIRGTFHPSEHFCLGAISIGEQSFRCSLQDVHGVHPAHFSGELSTLNFGRCFDVRFTGGKLIHQGSARSYPVIRFGGHNATGYPPARNVVAESLIRNSGNIVAHVHVGGSGGREVPTSCSVLNCHMPDRTSSGSSIRVFDAVDFSSLGNDS